MRDFLLLFSSCSAVFVRRFLIGEIPEDGFSRDNVIIVSKKPRQTTSVVDVGDDDDATMCHVGARTLGRIIFREINVVSIVRTMRRLLVDCSTRTIGDTGDNVTA